MYSEKPKYPNKSKVKAIIATILILILPFPLGIGVIGIVETHPIDTQPFNKYDITENQDPLLSIRSKMVNLGFNLDVVDSMPDSEIALYENIKSVQSRHSSEFSCDGGKLIVSQYVSNLDSQTYRFTAYYIWTQKPKIAHAEALGIVLNREEVVQSNNTEFASLNLYDIKNDNGNIQTYCSKDIADNQNVLQSVKKFKLTNKKSADNYRGYIATNVQMSSDKPFSFNNSFYYIHQSTILNNRSMDIIDFNKDKGWSSSENEDFYFKEYNIMAIVDTGE